MFTVKEIVQPTSVEDAYSILTKKKNNQVIGGSAWMRMGKKRIGTGIELSRLDLDYIKDESDYVEIGAMTTFRSLETSKVIEKNFGSIIRDSVADIIGIQFRNVVTIGGTIFSRFGFSDLLTALLALNCEVELFKLGRITLSDFIEKKYEKDLLIKICIKKDKRKCTYKSLRNAKSDYPLINVSVSNTSKKINIYVGARPQIAKLATKASDYLTNNELNVENIEKAADLASKELIFGTNMRASKEYREAMAKVLIKRALMEVK